MEHVQSKIGLSQYDLSKNMTTLSHLDLSPKVTKKEKNMEWTKEQKQAIYEKGENILVAAAARKWKDSCAGRKNYK